ncbi:hypothetical protein WJX84_004431 [Apatococcus fuscideae]|uniref:Ubiquitin-like protease family profile domain-containing protein n=1 Tax=Apatococcus fuscideae TaxID=2026836 RepID=A0AAW1T3A1_9CHLO
MSHADKFKKWTKGTDIFQKNYLFVPVHRGLHWILLIVGAPAMMSTSFGPRACIIHLDSIEGGGHPKEWIHETTIAMQTYLRAEWLRKEQDGSSAAVSHACLGRKFSEHNFLTSQWFRPELVPLFRRWLRHLMLTEFKAQSPSSWSEVHPELENDLRAYQTSADPKYPTFAGGSVKVQASTRTDRASAALSNPGPSEHPRGSAPDAIPGGSPLAWSIHQHILNLAERQRSAQDRL